LQADLAELEQHYHLSSDEFFYQRFQAGQMGDDMDYVKWASLMQMADSLEKRLNLLHAADYAASCPCLATGTEDAGRTAATAAYRPSAA
jgi:hypothetical protein